MTTRKPPRFKPAAPKRGPHKGVVVNPEIRAPRPPGGWVDDQKNYVTGELYKDFHPGITNEDGARRLQQEGRRQGIANVYISRGPVLWAMRVLKLEAWYLRAMNDGAAWDPVRRRPLQLTQQRKRTVKRKPPTYKPDPRWGF